MERLAERFTVIRYDKPGCGLSDRDGIDLSFDGQVAAALAVADAVRAGRFSLFGASQGGQLAAAIAAKCPERVEALVLYGMCASGADLAPAEVRDSIVALMRAHWGLGSKVLTGIFIPDPSAEEVEAFTRLQRASASAAVAQPAARGLLRHRHPGAAADDPGADRGPAPGGGQRHTGSSWGARWPRSSPGRRSSRCRAPAISSTRANGSRSWTAMLGFLGEGAGPRPRLTRRELEVARLVADGLTNHAIATRLSVAPRTAEAHVENIRRKLQVRSRAQIAAWITEHRPAAERRAATEHRPRP